MKNIIVFIFFLQFIYYGTAQAKIIEGQVFGGGTEKNTKPEPLVQANVYIAETIIGTTTDEHGYFKLLIEDSSADRLVFSFIGYLNDTLLISGINEKVHIILKPEIQLNEVTVSERLEGEYISSLNPIKTEVISSSGLQKLACCNLSESFENTASVDVGYSDAVTGAKHIQMLGLAGIYSQMLSENIPDLRGLAAPFGLTYIPGSWMESVQISKGTASVINGYESITGQINIELLKPEKSDPLFVNLYTNSLGKMEMNLTGAQKVNDKWSTLLLTHGEYFNTKIDKNNDSFLDKPLNKQINLFNRWKYKGEKMRGQFGFKYLYEDKEGGQLDYFDKSKENQQNKEKFYALEMNTKRFQAYGKSGFLFQKPHTSLGLMAQFTRHENDSKFGNRPYKAKNTTFYFNSIFQSYFLNTSHNYSAGLSYLYDEMDEMLSDEKIYLAESVPGAFFQYSYLFEDKLNIIAGVRSDYNSQYGFLVTPRLHLKYNLTEKAIFRGSIGKGYRSPHVIAENLGLLATSRSVYFDEEFEIEQAWNMGMNFTKEFRHSGKRKTTFSMDYYRTEFENQVIVDLDKNIHGIHFYNLKGSSYSNSYQAQVTIQPIKRMDITYAVRYNDVKQSFSGELKRKPLVKDWKGLLNLSYSTNFNKWSFDLTAQYNGKSRLPSTIDNPKEYRKGDYSPGFFVLFGQVTKRFKHFDVYVGGENLTGFTQSGPIVASDNPFSEYFDASMIWGPLLGRKLYAGLRYTLK